tara:strand:+ start:169861 stop:170259 length:399 start_codon:yes stop_codon:yes gene_type:complete
MKKQDVVLRYGLGLMLLAFGLNKFLWFMTDFDFTGYPEAEYVFTALRFSWSESIGKGYIMNFVGITEAVVGSLLVLKKWVPFALVMLVPISVNIILFHVFLNIPNIIPAILVALVNGYLIYTNRDAYRPLFK